MSPIVPSVWASSPSSPPPASRGSVGCSTCGSTPSVNAEFRQNTGLFLAWKRESASGQFCRPCGLSAFRSMTNHSLLFGWWGLFSFFGTFYAVGQNLVNRRKVVQLAQPTPTVTSEGSRLIRRPGPYVAVALLGFVGYLGVGAATTSDGEALDGECVVIEGDTLRATRCSSDHDGKVIAVLRTDSTDRCPRSTDDALVLDSDPDHVLCLDLDG